MDTDFARYHNSRESPNVRSDIDTFDDRVSYQYPGAMVISDRHQVSRRILHNLPAKNRQTSDDLLRLRRS